MKMIKSFSKFILTFIALFTTVIGVSQTLNLNQFGIEEGLPQSSVHSMIHDDKGNIWVGTMAGVSKYNGLMFENFSTKNGLAENRVLSSFLDKDGNIWFGHWAGGISVYVAKQKKFYEVSTGKLNIYKNVTSIIRDSKGNVLFGTSGLGLLKYTPSADSIQIGNMSQLMASDGLPSDVVNSLVNDKNGITWVATEKGVVKYDGDKTFTASGLANTSVKTLFYDSKGNLWIGTYDKGVTMVNSSGVSKTYDVSKGLSANDVSLIFESSNGTIFVGTYSGGVSKYLPALEANGYKGPLFQKISIEQGLSSSRVLSMIEDREKNIWIGTALNLNQYFDEQFEIYGGQEGLKNSLIWSVIQDKAGNYWLGSEGGLVKFVLGENTNKSTFVNYTSKGNTTALYEDINGNIWFSDFTNGVSKINPSTRQVTNYTVKNGSLKSDEVYTIAGDNNGNVWIGTNKGGVSVFDIKTNKFQNYTITDGLGSNQVFVIYKDGKGNMWLGSLGGELTMHDGKKFYKYTKVDGYPAKFTVCITEDKTGNIWLGTYGDGLYKYDSKVKAFKNYSVKSGLSSDAPFMLTADDKNNLWIGTGLGVDRFNIESETFKHYGKNDGFLGVEINPNSVCKDNSGNLWFGSILGVVRYNASNAKTNVAEPITIVKDPRVNFETAEIPTDHIFSYGQNHLTFDFVGASLTNPKRVRYKYMLEGLDKDWSPVVKENYVTYPNIPQGKYTFKVVSSNNDGVWNKQPVTYSFEIKPPFYKTWYFYLIIGVVVVLVVFTIIKNRERVLRERNLELEGKVNQRTEELNLQKVEVEKKNANITDSIDYAKRIQDAVFVAKEQISKWLPQSFILFKPKDIVSGDFYWMNEKDGKIFFAAVDCTGHGVPGAFMSIIGYNLLNTIVDEKKIYQPAQILNELDRLVFETLSSSSESGKVKEVKDGMDVGICVYDPKNMSLEYAGAYNSLYHVRKGELTEYKADKLPIGKSSIHTDGQFTNYSVKLEKGDMLYLFSDGYADQIGGPKRKKFYYGPFKEMLSNISGQSMNDQKNKLDKTIVDWLGNREQVDDIIVMGVKV